MASALVTGLPTSFSRHIPKVLLQHIRSAARLAQLDSSRAQDGRARNAPIIKRSTRRSPLAKVRTLGLASAEPATPELEASEARA